MSKGPIKRTMAASAFFVRRNNLPIFFSLRCEPFLILLGLSQNFLNLMSANSAMIEREPQRQGVGGTFKAAALYRRVDALLDLRKAAPMSATVFFHRQEDSRCRFQKRDAPVTSLIDRISFFTNAA